MPNYETVTRKADALLHEGDRLGIAGKGAESRATLRRCRRLRMKAKALKAQGKIGNRSGEPP